MARTPRPGLDYITALVNDHVKIQPKSGREATEAFLQGTGDVLLSYENEALFIERKGDPVEHVTPPHTFKIENPAAVLTKSENAEKAKAFNDFLYTPEGQRLWAEAGLPPGRPDGRGGVRAPSSRSRRSCGPSPTSAAGSRSTPRCSRRTSAPSP